MLRLLLAPLFWFVALILLVGLACTIPTSQPTSPADTPPSGLTPSPPQTVDPLPTFTPPPGTSQYYGCAFRVYVPAELTTEEDSWCCVAFTPTSGEPVWLSISASKPWPGIDLETAFTRAVDGFRLKNPVEHAVTVLDEWGKPLTGLQSDFSEGNKRYRVLVFVRPDALLGDMGPTEVVYEIVAQAPANDWTSWETIFEVIFQSFQPADCYGI